LFSLSTDSLSKVIELSFTYKEGAAIKQSEVFNIINEKSARGYSRREIDNAIMSLFPGVVKKPMKIAKSGLHKSGGQQDEREKQNPSSFLKVPLCSIAQPKEDSLQRHGVLLPRENTVSPVKR